MPSRAMTRGELTTMTLTACRSTTHQTRRALVPARGNANYAFSSELTLTTNRNAIEKSDDRHVKLREIELKVIRYQDELEAGLQTRISGMTVAEQVQQYREQLLRKVIGLSS